MLSFRSLIATTAAFFAIVSPASAQNAQSEWETACADDGSTCTMTITVRDEDLQIRAATLLASVVASDDTVVLGAIVPLGVALRPGLQMIADGKTIEAEYDACVVDGCRAIKPLTAEELSTALAASEVDVRYLARRDGRLISVPIPTSGFEGALEDARGRLSK